ncbi:transglutaminase-like superfamily protein [Simiduia agarivorans SA1 = DSM 21679]|uniref:Transglutaminase-like superfamily protein n=1 Tax=Simiduia agarivorans (strain DSM 21679 / JCM 13881 / BCRC 17597 / SA1) TaxID=1117647 RepID=K4KHZ2_SIMAS|nr:transglutaminase-like superfamily protein [Simiduia agarivorans SA1 = DSM 21679]
MVLLIISVGGVTYWLLQKPTGTNFLGKKQILLSYQFELANNSDQLVSSAYFDVFAPLKQSATHQVLDIKTDGEFEVVSDHYGQQLIRFKNLTLPPNGARILTVRVLLAVNAVGQGQWPKAIVQAAREKSRNSWAGPEVSRLISILQHQQQDSLRDISEWLYTHVESVDYMAQDRGAEYALKYKRGDCTEFMSAFSALAQAAEYPVFGVGGFVVSESSGVLLKADAYHNWNQAFENQSWELFDSQRNLRSAHNTSYVAFRLFGLPETNLKTSSSQRFVVHDERLTAKMI